MKKLIFSAGLVAAAGLVVWNVQAGGSFDRLDEADRQVFQKRFDKDIWPLLLRGGKDGCVGCHRGGQVTALKFSGDSPKDFRMLLKDGFFIPNDSGSLHGRITDKNQKRRMPPGQRSGLTEPEAALLQTFILDLDKKQQKR